ncbi:MAG: hypothetical protein LBT87_01060 [Treponema sp.]|jgi:hypothetical protein|nr:hypothetical protein [Treponema sp.]
MDKFAVFESKTTPPGAIAPFAGPIVFHPVIRRPPVLRALAVFLLCLLSTCSTGELVEEILGSSSEAPVFLAYQPLSNREINFRFSLPVRVKSLNLEPFLPVESLSEGTDVKLILGENPAGGERFIADILVEDHAGNTLNVLIPFRTRNERVPRLLINELRTEYSKPRTEFVELKALEEGSLGALRLYIAGNTKDPLVFEFPPVEVAADEYILLHLRTLDSDTGAVNETGPDLDLSKGNEAHDKARDFWVPGSAKLLHPTDVVYLTDQDDTIIDAVILSEAPDSWWSKEEFVQAADMLYRQEAWLSEDGKIAGPQDAVITGKTTPTRSICREESVSDGNDAGDWYITANSSATPGGPNNPKRYEG